MPDGARHDERGSWRIPHEQSAESSLGDVSWNAASALQEDALLPQGSDVAEQAAHDAARRVVSRVNRLVSYRSFSIAGDGPFI